MVYNDSLWVGIVLTMFYCCVGAGWDGSLGRYGALYTLHYFYFVLTLVHYTSSYMGKVAVLTRPFPIRVDASCGDLYLRILCTVCFISY